MIWPFSRWFGKKDDPDDYERVLASLSLSISSAQTRLSEIRLRERRSTLLVTLYAIGFWMLYLLLWWTVLPRYQLWAYHSRDDRTIQSIIKGVPAVVGPIFILFIRRLVQLWYARKGDQEEKQLKALMAEQRTKIEEIKKKTNYYSTKNLLDRYDDSPSRKQPIPVNGPSTPVVPGGLRQRQSAAMNGTPASAPPTAPLAIQGQGRLATTPNRPSPLQNSQLLQPTPQQLPPPRKQWFDKVADALLGEDNESSNSKFALICENCFNHNGLVKEAEFDDMKYVCPKCGHFNRSPRQKRELEEKHARGGRALRAVNRNQESPPPTAMSSFPNSPEPYRSRFGDQTFSGLSNIPEPSPSPSDRDRSSSRPRGSDEDGDAEMQNAADTSIGEVDMDQGVGPAIKVD
ncbi:hypothetical protein M407DRAFT_204019 [Tulasnella calospora MUT 4182]|uniref:Endoplasmic reticulum junction formation protein lunapark n=1 Tax=Tulasnella calospora MUT 4182 TaxID=1051891 RepID=A0A0C3KXB7_9AGAM|nr:hypothetical protein M407DRAFT_204019 [Tulasnella calospora MUT 4182]